MERFEPLLQMAAVAGTVHVQHRVCGRLICRCRSGERHAGYYLFWREYGRQRKRYIPADQVEGVRAACDGRRRQERANREAVRGARAQWRDLAARVREVERHER